MNSIGRFAPSPSGALHFGSFITALGSYLQVKSQNGKWFVRIEDLDPPREVPGSAANILSILEKIGLYWDGEILYQSRRLKRYQEILNFLIMRQCAYFCDCSRHRIQSLPSHIYDNFCQNRLLTPKSGTPMAIRLKQRYIRDSFIDNIRGLQRISDLESKEDFIIRRKDGLFAYNLAVVIDDHEQGITDIMRGADLLPVTIKQISLYKQLEWAIPNYYHLPLVLNDDGNKLSKQNHAPAISLNNINQLIIKALQFLNQMIPDDWQDARKEQLLEWAISHFDINAIPKQDKIMPALEINHQ